MSFDKDYIEIRKIIESFIFKNKYFSLEPDEVINEGYINYDFSKGYIKEDFLKQCYVAIIEKNRESQYLNTTVIESCRRQNVTEKVCYGCNNSLPIQNFGITPVKRYNGEYLNSYCKECAVKKSKEWYDRKNTDERTLNLIKSTRKKAKKKYVDNLSIGYLRELCLKKHSRDDLKNNPQLLLDKRNEILKIREERKNPKPKIIKQKPLKVRKRQPNKVKKHVFSVDLENITYINHIEDEIDPLDIIFEKTKQNGY